MSSAVLPKKPKLKKDPDVDTSFLPDKFVLLTAVLNDHLLMLFLYISVPRDRDEKETQERVMLAQEWKAEQERIKSTRHIVSL